MMKIYTIDDVIAKRSKVRLSGRQLALKMESDNCREIAQRKSNGNLYATNPQCNYDPYKGKWMEQNGELWGDHGESILRSAGDILELSRVLSM